MSEVRFYQTVKGGQRELSRVTLRDGKLRMSGNREVVKRFLEPVDTKDMKAVEAAFKDAPRRFDGAYLRAEYIAEAKKEGHSPAAQSKKEGRFVTLQDLQGENYVVFIDGPGEGSGSIQSASTAQAPAAPAMEPWEKAIIEREEWLMSLPQDSKIEWGYAVKPDGTVVFDKKGTESAVDLSTDDPNTFEGAIFTHNHPLGNAFSLEDLATAISKGMREMRAVGWRDGKRYRYRMLLEGFERDDWEQFVSLYADKEREVRKQFYKRIRSGELDIPEASRTHHHTVAELVVSQLHQRTVENAAADERMTYIREEW